jgi:hypothetical protein
VETTESYIRNVVHDWAVTPTLVPSSERYDVYAKTYIAIAASGTVSAELAMLHVPTVVVYKMNPITMWIGRRLIHVKWVSLVNILLNRGVYPECLGGDANVDCVLDSVQNLTIPSQREKMIADLKSADKLWKKAHGGTCALIAEHLSNNIFIYKEFQSNDKLILSKNYRSGSNVQQIIDEVLDDYTNYQHYYFDDYDHINEYVVLSSKYKHLKEMYNKTFHDGTIKIQTDIGYVKMNKNDLMVLTQNLNDDFVNGDVVQIISKNIIKKNNIEFVFTSEFTVLPLLPYNYLTIHKSQGLGFKKIIVILDDMFEITMLYTALTRAREDIKFIVFKQQNIEQLELFTEAFKKLTKIVYK